MQDYTLYMRRGGKQGENPEESEQERYRRERERESETGRRGGEHPGGGQPEKEEE